jgi:hypothetical protein
VDEKPGGFRHDWRIRRRDQAVWAAADAEQAVFQWLSGRFLRRYAVNRETRADPCKNRVMS